MVDACFEGTVLHRVDTFLYDASGHRFPEAEYKPRAKKTKAQASREMPPLAVKVEMWSRSPLLLQPQTWQRYGYTARDADTTLEQLEVHYQWTLSLLFLSYTPQDPVVFISGCSSSFNRLPCFSFIKKKELTRKLIEHVRDWLRPRVSLDHTVLCVDPEKLHVPALPLYKGSWTEEEWQEIVNAVPSQAPSLSCLVHYPRVWSLRGQYSYVPYAWAFQKQKVEAVRVISLKTYQASAPYRARECLVTLPVTVEVGPDRVEYVLTDESCFWEPS